MRFLTITIAIAFAIFDLTKANYYGGDFMSSYTGQEPNYGPLPLGMGFPSTGYSQIAPFLPPPPTQAPPPQTPSPAPAPAPKPYGSYPPPVLGPIFPYGPIFPPTYQSQPPVFIPTLIDNNGRRHIRLGDHSFVQEEDTDSATPGSGMGTSTGTGTGTGSGNGYGYYGYYGYGGYPPRPTPPPTTAPTPTTLAPTTVVITTPAVTTPTTPANSASTTPSTATTLPTTTAAKGGVQNLSYYRSGYGSYGNNGQYDSDGKLNIGVNDAGELIFLDSTQQSPQKTTTLATATISTTKGPSTKYLNRKKTSKFHFKITPDNLLNVITL